MVECCSIPSIDTLDLYSIDTPSTSRSPVGPELTNFWSIQMSRSTVLSRLSTNCWSSVKRVSTEYRSGYRSSFDQEAYQGYWSRVSIDTRPWMPLVHMILTDQGLINLGATVNDLHSPLSNSPTWAWPCIPPCLAKISDRWHNCHTIHWCIAIWFLWNAKV